MVVKQLQVHTFTLCCCFLSSNPPPPPVPPNKLSQRRQNLANKDNSDKPADSSIPGINGGSEISVILSLLAARESSFTHLSAALDGVPFSLDPKFDMQVKVTVRHTHADSSAPVRVPHPDLCSSLRIWILR